MERSNAGGKRAGRDRVGMRGRQTAYARAPPMRETGREMIPRSCVLPRGRAHGTL